MDPTGSPASSSWPTSLSRPDPVPDRPDTELDRPEAVSLVTAVPSGLPILESPRPAVTGRADSCVTCAANKLGH